MPKNASIILIIAVVIFVLYIVAAKNDMFGKTESLPVLPNMVIMSGFKFVPDVLEVALGTKVTWRNDDSFPHNVISQDGGVLKSEVFNKGGEYSFTFDEAGEYDYFCSLHPFMKGKIIVK